MSVQELAAKTAAEIRTRGWHQGSLGADDYHPETCKVCVLGGINAALYGTPEPDIEAQQDSEYWTLVEALNDRLQWDIARDDYHVAMWNDNPNRTADEVLSLLDRVATS